MTFHLSCLETRLIKALRNQRVPAVSAGRYRGMADCASYAACGQRAATQRHRWLWPRNFEGEEPQLEDKRENNLRMTQARPGRRPARWKLANRAWPTIGEIGISQAVGQASTRDSNISRNGPGAVGPARLGRAPLGRVGPILAPAVGELRVIHSERRGCI